MNQSLISFNGYRYKNKKIQFSIKSSFLIYIPDSKDLNRKLMSVNTKHIDGGLELEAHSLWRFYRSKSTSNYFNNTKN